MPQNQDPAETQLAFLVSQPPARMDCTHFCPCKQLSHPLPTSPPWDFRLHSPYKWSLKGKEQFRHWRGGWTSPLPANQGPWRRRRTCGRRGWGTRKALCSSCLRRDRASLAGSPPLGGEQSSSRMARTPPAPPQNEQAWVQQGKPHHAPQHQLLGRIKHPVPSTASRSQPQATTICRGPGAHPNTFSKLLHLTAVHGQATALSRGRKAPPTTLYM